MRSTKLASSTSLRGGCTQPILKHPLLGSSHRRWAVRSNAASTEVKAKGDELVKVMYQRKPGMNDPAWNPIPSVKLDPEEMRVKVQYERKAPPGGSGWRAIPSPEIDPDELKVQVLYQRKPPPGRARTWVARPPRSGQEEGAKKQVEKRERPVLDRKVDQVPEVPISEVEPLLSDKRRFVAADDLTGEGKVLVFGATGKIGSLVAEKLAVSGRQIVMAVRDSAKALERLSASSLSPSKDLEVVGGIDVNKPETLDKAELWNGVTQVVIALGPTSEDPDVERDGTKAVVEAAKKNMSKSTSKLMNIVTAAEMAKWDATDDSKVGGSSTCSVVLEGKSAVEFKGQEAQDMIRWSGNLVVKNGGFCGLRGSSMKFADLHEYDGITFRCRGNFGQTYKLNIRTSDLDSYPAGAYQTTFDTDPDRWTEIFIPWYSLVAVNNAKTDVGEDFPALDPSKITQISFLISRFDLNARPNVRFKEGPFNLQMEGGLNAFREERPQLVMVSSVGVERNAMLGPSLRDRAMSIPIVQNNPGHMLNYLYEAEKAVENSQLSYSIVRLSDVAPDFDEDGTPHLVEAEQGDMMSGFIGRNEAAEVIVETLESSLSKNKTFEVRRNEASDAVGKYMGERDWISFFRILVQDRERWRSGLPPKPRPSKLPLTEQEGSRAELLAESLKFMKRKAKFVPGAVISDTTDVLNIEPLSGAEAISLRTQLSSAEARIKELEEVLAAKAAAPVAAPPPPPPAPVEAPRSVAPPPPPPVAAAAAPVVSESAAMAALKSDLAKSTAAEAALRKELDAMAGELTSMSESLMEQASAMAAAATDANAATEALKNQLNASVARLVEAEARCLGAVSAQKSAELSLKAAKAGAEAEAQVLREELVKKEAELEKLRNKN